MKSKNGKFANARAAKLVVGYCATVLIYYNTVLLYDIQYNVQ